MNYNRRSTRPDSLFYRQTRKLGHPTRRGRVQGIPIPVIVVAAVIVAGLIYWLLFRH